MNTMDTEDRAVDATLLLKSLNEITESLGYHFRYEAGDTDHDAYRVSMIGERLPMSLADLRTDLELRQREKTVPPVMQKTGDAVRDEITFLGAVARYIGLKHAVISLERFTKIEHLDLVLVDHPHVAVRVSMGHYYGLEEEVIVPGPLTIRGALLIFDRMLQAIDGQADHVFVEGFSTRRPRKDRKDRLNVAATVEIVTGS